MNNEDRLEEREYAIFQGKPYLTKDAIGRYVILQEETIFSAPKKSERVDQCYTTEALINPKPSKKEIFAFKLRGAVKENTFATGRRLR